MPADVWQVLEYAGNRNKLSADRKKLAARDQGANFHFLHQVFNLCLSLKVLATEHRLTVYLVYMYNEKTKAFV